MAKLLITGGAGFIGANFARFWRRTRPNDTLVVLDALTYAGNRASLEGIDGLDFVQGDIRDYDLVHRLLTERDLDTLVHFAAESHVDRSIHGPDAFIDTNVIGTHTLLKAAKAAWLETGSGRPHRFHHVSTDEVFGSLGPRDPAFSEITPYAPNSPYSASKAGSDHLVRAYQHTYRLQTSTSNCSNNYGPYQFPEKLIPLFILNALEGKALPIYGDGMNVRDWLHVEDHCHGIGLVLDKGRSGETYCIGGGAEMTNLTMIDAICTGIDEAFAANPELAKRFPKAPAAKGEATRSLKTFVTDRPGHDQRYAIDPSKAQKELGYAPQHDVNGGLAQTIDWYLAHEPWWRAVQDGSYRDWVDRNYGARGAPKVS